MGGFAGIPRDPFPLIAPVNANSQETNEIRLTRFQKCC